MSFVCLYATELRGLTGREVRVEVALVFPHGPADPSEFIGQPDGGLVVTDTGLELPGPALQRIPGLPSSVQLLTACEHRAGPMDDEGAQVDIALLGYLAQMSGVP